MSRVGYAIERPVPVRLTGWWSEERMPTRPPRPSSDARRRRPRPSGGKRYGSAWTAKARAAVAAHLAENGPVCPGWGVPPHPVDPDDLTVDHPVALANGGGHDQPVGVLCRRCNAAKGAR